MLYTCALSVLFDEQLSSSLCASVGFKDDLQDVLANFTFDVCTVTLTQPSTGTVDTFLNRWYIFLCLITPVAQ